MNEAVVNYWRTHYTNKGLCALCGDQGTIDTRPFARSAAGVKAGMFTYCICPNGQLLREHGVTRGTAVPLPVFRPIADAA